MDHVQILKRSWHIMWRYKALWIFGLILALTTFSWESAMLFGDNNGGQGSAVQYELSEGDREWLARNLDLQFQESLNITSEDVAEFIQNEVVQIVVLIIILVVVVISLMILIGLLLRYLSETALIKMVNDYEKTGIKYGIRQGLQMAWSRPAWRLFLIDLAVFMPAILLSLVFFALVIIPIVALATTGTATGIAGAIAAGGLFFLVLALIIVASAVLSVLARIARQACVIDNLGVMDSIRGSVSVIRANVKDVGLMWLIMIGINLTWPFLMIPVAILLVGLGILLGGALAALVGGLGSLATAGAGAWIAAGMLGVILFLLILVAPLALLTGIREVFQSSAWTLTYRELRAIGDVKVETTPKPAVA
jgi:hypothetical protein